MILSKLFGTKAKIKQDVPKITNANERLFLRPMLLAVDTTYKIDPELAILARKKFIMMFPLKSDEFRPNT